jgi:hypothetical protein
VVGEPVAGQHPKGEILSAAAFELPGGPHAKAAAVQQHAKQQLGVVGRMPVPIGPVGTKERLEVDLVDHVEEEPRQVVVGQPVSQVGREQDGLIAVAI